MTAEPFLVATGIEKSFVGFSVLKGIDLTVGKGEVLGLLGENGAGKSTLMNIISGGIGMDAGGVHVDGESVRMASVADGIALGIRFIHQELSVFKSLSVAENIVMGDIPGRHGVVDRTTLLRRAREALAQIGAGHIPLQATVGALRLGEQQLVEIAKAVSRQPRLLIMDEPTASLTAHETEIFLRFVRSLAAGGTSVIFITHRLDEALSLCDRLLVLRNGAVVAERRPAEVTRDVLIRDMTGRASLVVEDIVDDTTSTGVRLSVTDASDGVFLAGITLDLFEGEVLGLFGLVGAGRTELIELLCGLRPCLGGDIRLRGKSQISRRRQVNPGFSLVPEGRKTQGIFPQHSVQQNMAMSAMRRLGRARGKAEAAAMEHYRTSLGIKMRDPSQPIVTLSGGNQQKVLIARALFNDPDVLLLDEPTHGVDVGAKADIYAIIRREAAGGRSIVVASSEVDEVRAVCDRVAVLSKGRLVEILDRTEMDEGVLLTHAFAGH